VITERLADAQRWLRIAAQEWANPLDTTFAQARGGRWNPPGSWRTLYLNEDLVTSRLNLRTFIADWPYEPEDLRSDTGPHLAVATLPRDQEAADVHTPAGVAAVGLPVTYPLDAHGRRVDHPTCQAIGRQVKDAGLRGIRCRSARTHEGAGRELAWFPATARSRARLVERLTFDDWYWS
jgi:hypothetical protein